MGNFFLRIGSNRFFDLGIGRLIFQSHRRHCEVAIRTFFHLENLQFCFGKACTTMCCQAGTFLKSGNHRFQRQFVGLHRFNNGFQALHRFFKRQFLNLCGGWAVFCRFRHLQRRLHEAPTRVKRNSDVFRATFFGVESGSISLSLALQEPFYLNRPLPKSFSLHILHEYIGLSN